MTSSLTDPGAHVLDSVREFVANPGRLFIDGGFTDARAGGTFSTEDPATGEVITTVQEAAESDLDQAVEAARKAFAGPWRETPPNQRGRLIWALAELVDQNAEELAQIESLDQGKPAGLALAVELPMASDQLRYFAGWATKIEGSTISPSVPGQQVQTRREPMGVVGAIVPWNTPLVQAAWKLAPILASGCTVVLKPAEQTPLSTLRLAGLVQEAGFPGGVVNVLTGDGRLGSAMVRHPGIDAIAFTGSIETGKDVAHNAADLIKPAFLELGGKSPNIVFADADLGAAAQGATLGIFFNSGQVCSAGSRLMVERSVHDEFVELVRVGASQMKIGPGLHGDSMLGPLVSQAHHDRVSGYIAAGKQAGGRAILGGAGVDPSLGGYFLDPTILADLPDSHACVSEEIFGPVLVTQPFDSVDEVIDRANGTEYGLAAAVWTRDIGKANRIANAIEAGTVWINSYHSYDPAAPHGGFKHSGYGRDNSEEALTKYLRTKAVWTALA